MGYHNENVGVSLNITTSFVDTNIVLLKDNYSLVEGCCCEGAIEGVEAIGGLIGESNGLITNSFAKCSTSGDKAGGLVGTNKESIAFCYAASVSECGLIGNNYGSVASSYYDTIISNAKDFDKGTPKTTSLLKQSQTFNGWDSSVWSFSGDYPLLSVYGAVPSNGDVSITSVVSTANAQCNTPVVEAASLGSTSVAAIKATATAETVNPTVTATSPNVSVVSTVATSTAEALPPTLLTEQQLSVAITSVVSMAQAQSHSVVVGVQINILSVAAQAHGQVIAPQVVAVFNIDVMVPARVALATAFIKPPIYINNEVGELKVTGLDIIALVETVLINKSIKEYSKLPLINTCIRELSKEAPYIDIKDLLFSANSNSIELQAKFNSTEALKLNGNDLKYTPITAINDFSATGTPDKFYYKGGRTLVVHPTPTVDTVMTHIFKRGYTEITSLDQEIADLPSYHVELIAYWVAMKTLETENNREYVNKLTALREEYQNRLANLKLEMDYFDEYPTTTDVLPRTRR